jgi:hypothetical protein
MLRKIFMFLIIYGLMLDCNEEKTDSEDKDDQSGKSDLHLTGSISPSLRHQ